MEISIVILSCVILGLNPEMPVFIRLIMICNLNGFRQIKYIAHHIYVRTNTDAPCMFIWAMFGWKCMSLASNSSIVSKATLRRTRTPNKTPVLA